MKIINPGRAARPLGIALLVILFAGAIGYSVRSVRYRVDQVPVGEFVVTKLSLNHSIERDSQGSFTNPYVEKTSLSAPSRRTPTAAKVSGQKPAKKAAPVVAGKEAKPKPTVKKPAVKKPLSRTVVPKKTQPKKPSAKKPVVRKPPPKKPAKKPSAPAACPT